MAVLYLSLVFGDGPQALLGGPSGLVLQAVHLLGQGLKVLLELLAQPALILQCPLPVTFRRMADLGKLLGTL